MILSTRCIFQPVAIIGSIAEAWSLRRGTMVIFLRKIGSRWRVLHQLIQMMGPYLKRKRPMVPKQVVYTTRHTFAQLLLLILLHSIELLSPAFEDPSTGNWTYSNSLVVNTDSFSGVKSFKSNSNSIYITKNLDAAQYEISYWIKGQAATLELSGGAVQQTFTEEEQNGWTLMRILFTMTNSGIVKIRVPQNAMVDDVRLKPKGASMVTTVYNSEGNAIVRTSNSLFSTRFEYDGQYRLTNLRNHKGEIVKQYQYHYRDQQ